MYDELIKALRKRAERWKNLRLDNSPDERLYTHAADAIEELGNKLCDWCGVCPKEKRSVWDCEIAFPNAPIPEVWIEPPKEETE